METSQNQTDDLDTVVTLAVIELLVQPEHGFGWLEDLALSNGIELTEAQTEHIAVAVNRTLDQLAGPFVASLPDGPRAHYEAILRKRLGYSDQVEEIALP